MIEDLWKRQQDFISRYADIRVSLPAGGMTLGDYRELDAIVRAHACPGMRIAELGCWVGVSTVLLATIAREHGGSMTCVDHFEGSPGDNLSNAAALINVRGIFEQNLLESGLRETVTTLFQQSTARAADCLPNKIFDVIFVDADHRYHAFKEDLELWWPKVKEGGLMCGHDCEILLNDPASLAAWDDLDWAGIHPGVVRGVAEKFPHAKKTPTAPIWYVTK